MHGEKRWPQPQATDFRCSDSVFFYRQDVLCFTEVSLSVGCVPSLIIILVTTLSHCNVNELYAST